MEGLRLLEEKQSHGMNGRGTIHTCLYKGLNEIKNNSKVHIY